MADDSSGLRLYSLGIVVKAKVLKDDYIYADPIEQLPMDKGPISGESKVKSVTTSDAKGTKTASSMTGGSTIIAKWFAGSDGNRQSAPDVQPGETVRIYRFADTKDYYWETLFREPGLRRLETVVHAFSNLPGGSAAFDDDTSYWVKYSTHEKLIQIHTSSNDGEPVAFDIIINAKEGKVEIKDDIDNYFGIDSVEGTLTGKFNKAIDLNAAESVSIKTKSFKLDAESSEIAGSSHTVNAALSANEGLAVKAGSTGGAAVGIEGNVKLDGELSGTGTIATSGEVHGSNIN